MHRATELGDIEKSSLCARLSDSTEEVISKAQLGHYVPSDFFSDLVPVLLVRIDSENMVSPVLDARPVEATASSGYIVASRCHDTDTVLPNHRSDLSRKISGAQGRRVCQEHRVRIGRGSFGGCTEGETKEALELFGGLRSDRVLADVYVGQLESFARLLPKLVAQRALFTLIALDDRLCLVLGEALLCQRPFPLCCRGRQADQEEPGPVYGAQRASFVRVLDRSEDVGGPSVPRSGAAARRRAGSPGAPISWRVIITGSRRTGLALPDLQLASVAERPRRPAISESRWPRWPVGAKIEWGRSGARDKLCRRDMMLGRHNSLEAPRTGAPRARPAAAGRCRKLPRRCGRSCAPGGEAFRMGCGRRRGRVAAPSRRCGGDPWQRRS